MSSGTATAALSLMVLGALSKVLGFLRDQVIAAMFGASAQTDAYLVGLTVPTVGIAILSSGVSTTFVPLYSERKGDLAGRCDFWLGVLWLSSILLFSIAGLGAVFARQVTGALAPGLDSTTFRLATICSAIVFPGVAFTGLTALAKSALNCHGQFAVPALAPVVQNCVIITFSLVAGRRLGVVALALGQALGMVVGFLIQLPWLRKHGFCFGWPRNWRIACHGAMEVYRLALPLFASSLVGQVYTLVDRNLASHLVEGSIAALSFADKLRQLPLGLFVTPLTTVLYPGFAARVSKGDTTGLGKQLAAGVRLILMIMLPAAAGVAVLSRPIVRLVFERGAFDASDTLNTARALVAYSPGMLAMAVGSVLTFGMYSLKVTLWPMVAGAVGAGLNILLDLLLVAPMGHVGLALANSCGSVLSMVLLGLMIHRVVGRDTPWTKELFVALGKIVGATAGMCFVALALARILGSGRAILTMLLIGVSAATYFLLLLALGSSDVHMLLGLVRHRLGKY
ncbi:MAG: murein biosynthesis integral membrane protein MurJ [Bacillota bacterium]